MENLKESVVRVGSREVLVNECGQGPALLMLHGGGPGASGLSNYGRNITSLSEDFRIIVADMPGYGGSTKFIDKSDTFGDLASAMLGLLDALGLSRAHIVGNSLGGAAALRMAMDAPDRVDRMVLMGPGGIGTTRSLPTRGLNHLLNFYKGDGPTREKLAVFLREYLVADPSTVSDEMIDTRLKAANVPDVVANPPLTRPKGLGAALRMDLTRDARLQQIPHPVLAVWGDADKVNRPSGGDWMQRKMKNCDQYVFSGAGHWVQWERAEQFNAVCKTFLTVGREVQNV